MECSKLRLFRQTIYFFTNYASVAPKPTDVAKDVAFATYGITAKFSHYQLIQTAIA